MTPPVRLRPVEEADLALLTAMRWDPNSQSEFDDFLSRYPRNGGETRRARWLADGLLGAEAGTMLVEAEGRVVGDVQWRPVSYGGPEAPVALEIGIGLLVTARGRGIGTAAQRQLVTFLMSHTATHRVQATTDVSNLAEQRSLEKAGFLREGVIRGAQWRRGQFHDMALYARLRSDPGGEP